jgi:hypothetical protein
MAEGVLPFNLEELLGGAVRVLWAPITEDVPANILDIHDMVSPYAPNGDWADFGAAASGSSYGRGISSEGYEIQQSSTAVIEEITGTARRFTTNIAEITPEHLAMIEEGGTVETITASALKSAQKKVPFGNIDSLTRRRIAFVGRRAKGIGADVTEPASGPVRGAFVCGVLYACALSADEASITFEKGNLASADITFTAFPISGQDPGEEVGCWLEEQSGTIAAT